MALQRLNTESMSFWRYFIGTIPRNGHAQNRSDKSFQDLLEYIEVLGPEDSEVALGLLLKATRIHLNAEKVETWLANVDKNGSEP
jgi:hypothetical protein